MATISRRAVLTASAAIIAVGETGASLPDIFPQVAVSKAVAAPLTRRPSYPITFAEAVGKAFADDQCSACKWVVAAVRPCAHVAVMRDAPTPELMA
jgi:hypothetical protein